MQSFDGTDSAHSVSLTHPSQPIETNLASGLPSNTSVMSQTTFANTSSGDLDKGRKRCSNSDADEVAEEDPTQEKPQKRARTQKQDASRSPAPTPVPAEPQFRKARRKAARSRPTLVPVYAKAPRPEEVIPTDITLEERSSKYANHMTGEGLDVYIQREYSGREAFQLFNKKLFLDNGVDKSHKNAGNFLHKRMLTRVRELGEAGVLALLEQAVYQYPRGDKDDTLAHGTGNWAIIARNEARKDRGEIPMGKVKGPKETYTGERPKSPALPARDDYDQDNAPPASATDQSVSQSPPATDQDSLLPEPALSTTAQPSSDTSEAMHGLIDPALFAADGVTNNVDAIMFGALFQDQAAVDFDWSIDNTLVQVGQIQELNDSEFLGLLTDHA